MDLTEYDDCTCDNPMGWPMHTTSVDSSVCMADVRWLLDTATCPAERRNIRRVITKRLAAKVS